VLVTGASGFLGSALVPALAAAGFELRVFARRPPPPHDGVEVVIGDLSDAASLRPALLGVDAVVHLGAATSAGRSDPAQAYRVNVGGAAALLTACRAAGCRRVVALSTQHVHLARPGVYGRTKRIADSLFAGSGLDVTILRPSLVYGPGRRGVFVKLRDLVRKLPVVPVVGPGTWRLRPLFLPDMMAILVETLRRPELAGRSYDVGGPELVSYNAFLEAICRALGRSCRRVHLPLPVSFALAWTLERALANPPLTVENVHGARVEAPCDLTALLRDYRPALTPLSVGLPRALGEVA
jgi:NADH dehydrogenase